MAATMLAVAARQFSRGLQTGFRQSISISNNRCHCQAKIQPYLLKHFGPPSSTCSIDLTRAFSSLSISSRTRPVTNGGLLQRPLLEPSVAAVQPVRTKVLGSMRKCKPKTVKAVVHRFYRLHSGLWIRPKAGRAKKLHQKRSARKYRSRQHVFVKDTQNRLLNRMVTKFWKKPRYFVDDIYAPYHKRTGFTGDRVELPKPFWP